ncbi:hypothetical protein KKE99_02950 [Patescibacteria group bacterium]|nr:hypothetical protein [Patescibacteria group bacterium]
MFFSFFHRITWNIVNIVTMPFLKLIGMLLNLKVFGKENLNALKSGGVLFVSNHEGGIDPFLIESSIPIFYLLKIKYFRHMAYYKYITKKWYGFFIWLMGAYSVYPGSGPLEKVLAKTVRILKDNPVYLRRNSLFCH